MFITLRCSANRHLRHVCEIGERMERENDRRPVFLLDDGFRRPRLKRDEDMYVDALNPCGGRSVPLGRPQGAHGSSWSAPPRRHYERRQSKPGWRSPGDERPRTAVQCQVRPSFACVALFRGVVGLPRAYSAALSSVPFRRVGLSVGWVRTNISGNIWLGLD